jgi:hypothetical protein
MRRPLLVHCVSFTTGGRPDVPVEPLGGSRLPLDPVDPPEEPWVPETEPCSPNECPDSPNECPDSPNERPDSPNECPDEKPEAPPPPRPLASAADDATASIVTMAANEKIFCISLSLGLINRAGFTGSRGPDDIGNGLSAMGHFRIQIGTRGQMRGRAHTDLVASL